MVSTHMQSERVGTALSSVASYAQAFTTGMGVHGSYRPLSEASATALAKGREELQRRRREQPTTLASETPPRVRLSKLKPILKTRLQHDGSDSTASKALRG